MTATISLRNPLFSSTDVVVIDTETTGLSSKDEICQLSVVDFTGYKLFDEIIKPSVPISEEASNIHHITDETVKDCRSIPYYWDYFLKTYIQQKVVVGYNVMFDVRMLLQSAANSGSMLCNSKSFAPLMIIDVMQLAVMSKGFSKFPKLGILAELLGVNIPESGEYHNSLYDCKVTAACFREMVHL